MSGSSPSELTSCPWSVDSSSSSSSSRLRGYRAQHLRLADAHVSPQPALYPRLSWLRRRSIARQTFQQPRKTQGPECRDDSLAAEAHSDLKELRELQDRTRRRQTASRGAGDTHTLRVHPCTTIVNQSRNNTVSASPMGRPRHREADCWHVRPTFKGSKDQALDSKLGPQANLGRLTRMLRRQLLDRCDVVLQAPAHGVGLAIPRGVEGFGAERRACVVQSHHLRPTMNRVESSSIVVQKPTASKPAASGQAEVRMNVVKSQAQSSAQESEWWFDARQSRAQPAPGRPSRRACGSTDP